MAESKCSYNDKVEDDQLAMTKIIKMTNLPWQRSSRLPTGHGKDHQDDQLAVAKDHQDDPRSVPLKATSSKIPWADGWIIRR